QHGDVAAHAVAHQVHGLIAGEVVDEAVQVGQVVGEHVVVGRLGWACAAEAAPVGRQNGPALDHGFGQGVDHELVGGAHVHPAVHQEQGRGAALGGAPAPDVV